MWKLLCIFALISLVHSSDVLQLGDSDFQSTIADLDIVLVKFYAPWCGHCKKLAPEFDRAAAILKNDDSPVTLVKVDCTAEGEKLCGTHGVSGYPTLKIFRNGELAEDYNGPRQEDGIVKYMRSKAGPSSKNLDSVEAAEKFLSGENLRIVGFFESADSAGAKEFQKLADAKGEDFSFGSSSDSAVLEKYGYKDNVVIFRPKKMANKFEEDQVKYEGDITVSDLKNFVNDNAFGLAGHRTTGNQEMFKKPLVAVYYNVDYNKDPKGTNYWRNRVMKVAKKLKDEGKTIYFAVSSAGDFGHELGEFGLSFNDKPVVGGKNTRDEKFIMDGEFSMDALEKFCNDLLDGKLEAYLKSEPIPEDDGPVKTVVAKNFEAVVNDDSKDVLIEFYAPWCGHCKTLAPKYEELAEKLAGEESVVIAKMDATANDVPSSFGVQGFPTLFYVPKNSKGKPKKYEGGREVADFIKYLAKESTDGLKGYSRAGKKQKVEL